MVVIKKRERETKPINVGIKIIHSSISSITHELLHADDVNDDKLHTEISHKLVKNKKNYNNSNV